MSPGRGVDLVGFRKGERKDDVTKKYLRRWSGGEGVLYIGKTQEKTRVLRTIRRVDPAIGPGLQHPRHARRRRIAPPR